MSSAAPRETPTSEQEEIRVLIELGRWDEARRRLAALRARGASAPWMAGMERAIAPGRVQVLASHGRGGSQESMAWLRAHGDEYRGQWVALRAGELLGSHPDRRELHRDLERRGLLDEALFARLDPEETT